LITVPFLEHRRYPSKFLFDAYRKGGRFSFLAHWHIEVELLYIIDGCFQIGINQKQYELNAGDLSICRSGDIHYYNGRGSLDARAVMLVFHPKIIGHERGWPNQIIQTSSVVRANRFQPEEQANLENSFVSAFTEYQLKRNGWELFAAGEINKICGMITRLNDQVDVPDKLRTYNYGHMDTMQNALHLLEHNYKEDLTLEQVAKHFSVSPFYFSRLFNKTVGMNFRSYINHLRIIKAEQMITSTDLSLTEVALDCGFQSIRTFNRAYKTLKGTAPSSLRNLSPK
jgi:AraC-like DNA-binding protein